MAAPGAASRQRLPKAASKNFSLSGVRAGIHKILDRIANREDPDQTCVWVGCSIFDRQLVFNISDTHTV